MGQFGLIQDIKCLFGIHRMNTFNYRKHGNLYYSDVCMSCHKGDWSSFVRNLSSDERKMPIWEILSITQEIYDDDKKRLPFLELPQSSTPKVIK